MRRCGEKLVIEDHKHSNNFQYKYKRDEPINPEYRIQTSIYAELYHQTFGVRPDAGIIWYHFSGANNSSNPPLFPKAYEFMPLVECLAHKPYGGNYTVMELYQQAEDYRLEKLTAVDLPLVGVDMAFGKADFCGYCQVRTECMTRSGTAPF